MWAVVRYSCILMAFRSHFLSRIIFSKISSCHISKKTSSLQQRGRYLPQLEFFYLLTPLLALFTNGPFSFLSLLLVNVSLQTAKARTPRRHSLIHSPSSLCLFLSQCPEEKKEKGRPGQRSLWWGRPSPSLRSTTLRDCKSLPPQKGSPPAGSAPSFWWHCLTPECMGQSHLLRRAPLADPVTSLGWVISLKHWCLGFWLV